MQRPVRQDTFDLRDQILADDHNSQMMDHAYPSDEEHSVLEDDDSDTDDHDFMVGEDDDGSSSLSIPNESIDFDLVYALHSFAATVEGQANVVKGDSLFLMDDSNSYWWLVRVLKTQEVGYIPAENIETPFERLARLNKHRNVDLASATHAELEETRDRLLENVSRGAASPSPTPAGARSSRHAKGVAFTAAFSVHRYPPAVWGDEDEEDEDVEWDDEGYEDEDPELAEEQEERERATMAASDSPGGMLPMEPDDGMSWEDGAVEQMQAREREAAAAVAEAERLHHQQEQELREQQQREQQAAAQSLRKQPSREHMQLQQSGGVEVIPNSPTKPMDPAHATETRKLTMTPPVARVDDVRMSQDERKRAREEEEEATRKKANSLAAERAKAGLGPSSGGRPPPGGGKLRKERDSTDDEGAREKDKKKKSGGMFGGIFGRKKDKDKDKGRDKGVDSSSVASTGSDRDLSRESEESGKSLKDAHAVATPEPSSPVTAIARQQQQQGGYRASPVAQPAQLPPQQAPQTPPQVAMASISQHASQLRQRDQQQQALYQQYLNRSPSTPPEAQPSYGLQSASAVLQGSASFTSSTSSGSGLIVGAPRPRPGSLVLSPSGMDGLLPDLSVVRVFAGSHLQTEATFKTVLLNTSTTAQDLVRQAIQRFRLPAGEDEKDYYLTIKQVEGSSADLLPNERPLGVFESLVEAALELPKVKRSSVGSISSVASNLSMHPAIKKLSMNDFTDDSAVKFYLNRRRGEYDEGMDGEGDETLLAEGVQGEDPESPRAKPQYLTVTATSPTNIVTAERFSSPSYRFPLQLVIYPDDLPDDMVFDPQTEAIVFKNTLRDRPQATSSPGVPQNLRKKVFVFPRNVTVAEVIEIGLERFGILEGVVDGGDEIEDKATKRRSSSRVRYGLTVDVGGKERELPPSSKAIDSFPRPPTYRAVQSSSKRRSVDSAQLLGNLDDVSPDDPVFILRRAVAYRATSRHRLSAPLDEIALQRVQRNSASSSSAGSDSTVGPAEDARSQTSQTSKQAIIAAQRAATRASQRAILSAQANEARGLDVALPGGAMVRSLRGEVDNRMRYSYVEPDGETYDISNIVEEEWRGEVGPSTRTDTTADDLLHGVLARGKDGLGAKLDRVVSKIKHEKDAARVAVSRTGLDTRADSRGAASAQSPSLYSTADERSSSRAATATPTASGRASSSAAAQRVPSSLSRISSYRTASPGESSDSHGKRSITPNANQRRALLHERQGSVLSEASAYRTATPASPPVISAGRYQTPVPTPRLVLPKDDFGLAHMMAVIELRASQQNKLPELTPGDRVDELLFGKQHDVNALHQDIRDIYSGAFKQSEEMDRTLEQLLHLALPTR